MNRYRTFNGKLYRFYSSYLMSVDAHNAANYIRGKGWFARIVRQRHCYAVWEFTGSN
jgi:hypothetical protein